MQTTDVTPGELQQAKALLLRQMPLRESSEEAVAGSLLSRAQMDLPLDEPAQAARRYFDLSAEEVRTAFQKWIRPEGFVQVADRGTTRFRSTTCAHRKLPMCLCWRKSAML
jgi:zinc protease